MTQSEEIAKLKAELDTRPSRAFCFQCEAKQDWALEAERQAHEATRRQERSYHDDAVMFKFTAIDAAVMCNELRDALTKSEQKVAQLREVIGKMRKRLLARPKCGHHSHDVPFESYDCESCKDSMVLALTPSDLAQEREAVERVVEAAKIVYRYLDGWTTGAKELGGALAALKSAREGKG